MDQIFAITICYFSELKGRERKKSKYSLKLQRCGQPVITLSNSLLNHSDIPEFLIISIFLFVVLTTANNVCLNIMVYFLFEQPVNQIFLFRTSKDDIVESASEDQALKML